MSRRQPGTVLRAKLYEFGDAWLPPTIDMKPRPKTYVGYRLAPEEVLPPTLVSQSEIKGVIPTLQISYGLTYDVTFYTTCSMWDRCINTTP